MKKLHLVILAVLFGTAFSFAQSSGGSGGGGGGGGGGPTTFDQVGSGTNAATLHCGTGCVIDATGSGQINATTAPQGNLTGDVTSSALSTTLSAIQSNTLTITSLTAGQTLCAVAGPVWQNCFLGVVPNAQSGTSYTVLTGDRNSYITFSNASPVAVTLPQAGSAGFTSNFTFTVRNIGAGAVTITPTTSTINAGATLVLATGEFATIYSDNTNYFAAPGAGPLVAGTGITLTKNAAGPTIALTTPVAVANGGTALASGTSGGILGFTGSTTLASSVALTVNVLPKGGGAGATPTNSSITDDGTNVTTTEGLNLGTSPPTATNGTGGYQLGAQGTVPSSMSANASGWYSATTGACMKGIFSSADVGCLVAVNATNTAGTAMTLDMSAATGATAFKVPVIAGATAGANGVIDYDSTNANTHIRTNAADSLAVAEAAALALNAIPKATDATHSLITASSITDNATKVSTAEFLKTGNTQLLTADSSGVTATTPGTTIFTWGALPVSTNFSLHCAGTYSQATGAAANGIAVQGATNAPTRLDAWGVIYTTNPASAAPAQSNGSLANLTTTTATAVVTATPGATATIFQWSLDGTVQTGASATTLNVNWFTGNASDAVTVKAGSFCTLMP